jgi:hypothetical protein
MGLPVRPWCMLMTIAHDNYEESDFLTCGIEYLMLKLLQTPFTKTINDANKLFILTFKSLNNPFDTTFNKNLSTSNIILLANVISFCWDTSKHLNRQFFIILYILG